MEIKRLTGGKVVGTNPNRLQIPLYADPPKIRVGTPGTMTGNVGMAVQLGECSKLQFGLPEPAMVKVLIREIDGQVYLLVGCAREAGPDVYALKYDAGSKAPIVRGLKPLFDEARIKLRTDLWYESESQIVHDESLGYAVAVNWTGISTRPRREAQEETAAAEQPEPNP